MKVYLSSPYGFTRAGLGYLSKLRKTADSEWGVDLLGPWDSGAFNYEWAMETAGDPREAEAWRAIASVAPIKNFKTIAGSDAVVAVLDGTDVDSGVACEVGYAFCLNIPVIGYRSDFRRTGESMHGTVNQQVEACLRGDICADWKQVGRRLNTVGIGAGTRRKPASSTK